MTQAFFEMQFERLRTRFGKHAMDDEFKTLVAEATQGMSDHAFKTTIDVFIGSRPHNRPPLVSDFREAKCAEHKKNFDAEVRQVAKVWDSSMREVALEGRKKALTKEFGAESIKAAFKVAVQRFKKASS